MANFPPPPTWADTEDPAWLNWFLTVSNQLEGVGATIAAGFTQAQNGTAKNCGTWGGGITVGNYADTDLTLVLDKTTRVIYWAEVGYVATRNDYSIYGAPAATFQPSLYRDSSQIRLGAAVSISPPAILNDVVTVRGGAVMLYSEDLAAGTYAIKLGFYVNNEWTNGTGYPLVINPRVLIVYVPT